MRVFRRTRPIGTAFLILFFCFSPKLKKTIRTWTNGGTAATAHARATAATAGLSASTAAVAAAAAAAAE